MKIPIDIQVDFLWGQEHFKKDEWAPITYVVGANGTGKSVFAEQLKDQFRSNGLKVRYFSAERIANLTNKWDTVLGELATDKLSKGLDIEKFSKYKAKADQLGQSIDALIELNEKLDVQIKVESVLNDVFHRQITFEQRAGFLNVSLTDTNTGETYDLRKNESHGLKEIITLLSFLYSDEYNCIILDEPELNLHPQFQQYILQEIKKCAGFCEEGKKMFVILTHSPYMLDINNSDDLLNYIVFHKGTKPSYIQEYGLEPYQMERLNKLLMRINTNHKTMFFATSPVFVEGYIDQQLFNLIESKRNIPLGTEGISIIDVGGKDEVDIMYALCRMLGIKAKAIVDLDALFEGKIRQTVSAIPDSSKFLAEQGQKDLLSTIGQVQKLTDEIVKALEEVEVATLDNPSTELSDLITTLKKISGDNALKSKRRIVFLALQRIPAEVMANIDACYETTLAQIKAMSTFAINCLELSDVFVLRQGEIENYYTTYTENQYNIADGNKTENFMKEYNAIAALPQKELAVKYTALIELLDKLCPVTKIDTKKMISVKLSDWIHIVQSLFRANNSLTAEKIKSHPKAQWNAYRRVIDIVEFTTKEKAFICKFKLSQNLTDDHSRIYEFDQNTVPSQFTII